MTEQPSMVAQLLRGAHLSLLREVAKLLRPPPPEPPRRWWSETVRTLHTDDEVATARREARSAFVALFVTRTGLTPPDEWLDRWWPAA